MKAYTKDLSARARLRARFSGGVLKSAGDYIRIRGYREAFVRRLFEPFKRNRRPKTWVFVTGCYNSGTKLVTGLIASHPDVAQMPQEGRFFTDAFPDTQAGGWRRMMYRRRDLWRMPEDEDESRRRVTRAVRDWSLLWNRRKAPVFVEKSICHTTRIPWLSRYFTEETPPVFIGITRNGYCVAESVRRIGEPVGDAALEVGDSYPLALCAEQWRELNATMLDSFNRTPRCHLVRLEDLCRDPIATLETIFQAIGLPVPEMHMEEGDILSIAGEKTWVRRDLNRKRLEMLKPEEIEEMDGVFADMMARLGYGRGADEGAGPLGAS